MPIAPAPDWYSRIARSRALLLELVSRLLCVACYAYFVYRILMVYRVTPNLTVTLLLIAESLTVLLMISARFAGRINRSFYPVVITLAASFYFVLVDLSDGVRLAPLAVTGGLQLLGILWQIVSKCYLGRSYGLLPANRGIVTSGPYRIVRHPVYLGYFLNHLGFLLAVWSPYNLLVYLVLYTLQFLRIREEERLLGEDPKYQQYKQVVCRRFIPFLI